MLPHIRITNYKVIDVISRPICCSAIYIYALRNFPKALKTKGFPVPHTLQKHNVLPPLGEEQ